MLFCFARCSCSSSPASLGFPDILLPTRCVISPCPCLKLAVVHFRAISMSCEREESVASHFLQHFSDLKADIIRWPPLPPSPMSNNANNPSEDSLLSPRSTLHNSRKTLQQPQPPQQQQQQQQQQQHRSFRRRPRSSLLRRDRMVVDGIGSGLLADSNFVHF